MNRTSWDDYFMKLASLTSSRATCSRLNVGCVLVKDKQIIATGYNGSISGHVHCDDEGHLIHENGCKRTIHAEMNALIQCAKLGVSSEGATAYITHYPCPECIKHLNQAGISRIVYGEFYEHRYKNNFHEGVQMCEWKKENEK